MPSTPLSLAILMLEGSVNIMKYGAGPNGVMRTLGNYMVGSGATFGCVFECTLRSLQTDEAQIFHVYRLHDQDRRSVPASN